MIDKNTLINLVFDTLLNRAGAVSIEVAPAAIWGSMLPISARDASVCASSFVPRRILGHITFSVSKL